jgi:ABC-type multidrug transport system permease subunit
MSWRGETATVAVLVRRALNEITRVPGAAIPGVLAPTIFFLGFTSVFGSLTLLPGFTTESYQSFLIPVSMLQGAGFTGAATGVNLARDIEQGWFDRLLASPAPRPVLLAGLVLSAGLRCLLPATFLLIVGLAVGVHWPGLLGLLIALSLVMGMAVVAATWGTSLALRFKTQSAAPVMQVGMFLAILTTTAYAPLDLLTGWLHTVAEINPVTQVVEAVRQGFVGSVNWSDTWPGYLTLFALAVVLSLFALRGMRRMTL